MYDFVCARGQAVKDQAIFSFHAWCVAPAAVPLKNRAAHARLDLHNALWRGAPDAWRGCLSVAPAVRTVPDALFPFLLLFVELALAARCTAGVLVLLARPARGAIEAAPPFATASTSCCSWKDLLTARTAACEPVLAEFLESLLPNLCLA